jgi:hypothetical protein
MMHLPKPWTVRFTWYSTAGFGVQGTVKFLKI